MNIVALSHRQSRHGSGSSRPWTPAWILGAGLLTGCQTFNYTEADSRGSAPASRRGRPGRMGSGAAMLLPAEALAGSI